MGVQTDLLQLIQDTHKVLSQALHTWELKAATVKNILTLHQIAKFDCKRKKEEKSYWRSSLWHRNNSCHFPFNLKLICSRYMSKLPVFWWPSLSTPSGGGGGGGGVVVVVWWWWCRWVWVCICVACVCICALLAVLVLHSHSRWITEAELFFHITFTHNYSTYHTDMQRELLSTHTHHWLGLKKLQPSQDLLLPGLPQGNDFWQGWRQTAWTSEIPVSTRWQLLWPDFVDNMCVCACVHACACVCARIGGGISVVGQSNNKST